MTNGDGGSGPTAPPGWYPDGAGWERRWDGTAWTDDRRPLGGEASPLDDGAADLTRKRVPGQPVPEPSPLDDGPAAVTQVRRPGSVGPPPSTVIPSPDEAIWPSADPVPPQGAGAAPLPHGPATEPPVAPYAPPAAPYVPPAAPYTPPPAAPPGYPPAPPSGPPAPAGTPYGAPGAVPGGPPPYGYGAAAAGGPGGTRGRRSRAWLWAVLAVVLVVLVATVVTLLVTRPWADDDGGRDGGGGEPTAGGDTEAAVSGDLDGDGLGDAVAEYWTDSGFSRWTLTNTGEGFEVEEVEVELPEDLLWGDFDGDGAHELLRWNGEAGVVGIEPVGDGPQPGSWEINTWDDQASLGLEAGDFDGDGLDDLVAYGQTRREVVTLWFLRSDGEGGFEDPAEWGAVENATVFSSYLFPADWDGDGIDDLLGWVPDQPLQKGDFTSTFWSGVQGAVFLRSTGSDFEVGDRIDTDVQLVDGDFAVGDFRGDGTPLLAYENYDGYRIRVFEFLDGALREVESLGVDYAEGFGFVEAMAASDVDGDGSDDLVFLSKKYPEDTYSGFQVVRSDGESFGELEEWAAGPECGDSCLLEFYNGS